MKTAKILAAAAATLVSLSSAHAAVVDWLVQGTVTGTSGSQIPSAVRDATTFSFIVNFEAAAVPTSTGPFCTGAADPGSGRCVWDSNSGAPLITFTDITLGAFPAFNFDGSGGGFSSSVARVRNNLSNGPSLPALDGYFFQWQQVFNDSTQELFLSLFDSVHLDLISDPRHLPTSPMPDSYLAGLHSNGFQICVTSSTAQQSSCDLGELDGTVTSIRTITAVPEPSTYAIMLLGLGAFAIRRRRAS